MAALDRLGLSPDAFKWTDDMSDSQSQTRQAFDFKWSKRDTYDSEAVRKGTRTWLIERYCGGEPSRVEDWLNGGRRLILDAGCGAGMSAGLLFGDLLKEHDYLGVDVAADALAVAKERFGEMGYPGQFVQGDISDLPIPSDSVDLILSEGVLHHTDDTRCALLSLSDTLVPGGRFLFYVYARKAEIREFTDDHIRSAIEGLTDDEAWNALMPLTKLGVALGELNTMIDVPEDIPFLAIKKGELDLQRFFYWNICKLFYRPDLSLEEMNHINFDWFRPLNARRHTLEEIEAWCDDAGLEIEHEDIQPSGITIVARKL